MINSAHFRELTEQQARHFLERSYVVIKGAIPAETADAWVERGFQRMGYDRHDPATWAEPRVHLGARQYVDARELAPRAWHAVCDLLGGEDRVNPWALSDGFILNLGLGADRPWQPPSANVDGWHKDGEHFVHFLDSPEQGLLSLVCWTGLEHQGGATFVACDSPAVVARDLAQHPEGMRPDDMDFQHWISQCKDFEELTAEPGDVVLLHPFTLHAASQNVRRVERIITNPPVSLREPMNFNRENADEFSLVEQVVLRGLGVDRLDFKPTGQRRKIEAEGARQREARLAEEQARESGVQ